MTASDRKSPSGNKVSPTDQSEEILRLQEQNNQLKSQLRDMSHETRGDAQPISTSIEELQRIAEELDINVPITLEQQQRLVERVKKISISLSSSVDHITESTSTFLHLDQYGQGEMTFENHPVNLYQFMKKLIRVYSPFFDDTLPPDEKATDVTFQLETDNKELWIMTDEKALKHIFKNFISNAKKFTEQGTITLSMKTLSHDTNNCKLSISISDSGCGMSETARQKLLHDTSTYTQVHNALLKDMGGSGRGFKLARTIINDYLKGTLKVEPNQKRIGLDNPGSTFTIEAEFKIPTQQQILAATPPSTPTPPIVPGKMTPRTLRPSSRASNPPQYRAHVLLVDDNKINLKLEAKVVEMLGYSCDTATNGNDALEKYRLNAKKYQIIIMDMCMPDENDGVEATQKIRGFERELGLPQCPIIGLSGLSDQTVKDTAIQAGMTEYLLKPMQGTTLGPIIEKLLVAVRPTQTLAIPVSLFGGKLNHHVSLSLYSSSSHPSNAEIESHSDSTTTVTTAETNKDLKLFQPEPERQQEPEPQPKLQSKPHTNANSCLGKCLIM